jgi:hypothetical protein
LARGFGGLDLQLAGFRELMVIERGTAQFFRHGLTYFEIYMTVGGINQRSYILLHLRSPRLITFQQLPHFAGMKPKANIVDNVT